MCVCCCVFVSKCQLVLCGKSAWAKRIALPQFLFNELRRCWLSGIGWTCSSSCQRSGNKSRKAAVWLLILQLFAVLVVVVRLLLMAEDVHLLAGYALALNMQILENVAEHFTWQWKKQEEVHELAIDGWIYIRTILVCRYVICVRMWPAESCSSKFYKGIFNGWKRDIRRRMLCFLLYFMPDSHLLMLKGL